MFHDEGGPCDVSGGCRGTCHGAERQTPRPRSSCGQQQSEGRRGHGVSPWWWIARNPIRHSAARKTARSGGSLRPMPDRVELGRCPQVPLRSAHQGHPRRRGRSAAEGQDAAVLLAERLDGEDAHGRQRLLPHPSRRHGGAQEQGAADRRHRQKKMRKDSKAAFYAMYLLPENFKPCTEKPKAKAAEKKK